MTISFKPAAENDISLIAQLADKIWREHYPAMITVKQIDYMLRTRYSAPVIATQMKAGEQFYLAYLDNEAVGYASIELKESYYYLHKFYLDVSKHRRGVGKEFFAYLLRQMDASKPIKLQVNRQNIKAINFYFKMGFTIEYSADFNIGENYFMQDFVMKRLPIW